MESLEITFEDLFDYLEFLDDNIINEFKNIEERNIFVETPSGLTKINNIIKKESKQLHIFHEFGDLKVSDKHIFVDENYNEILAKDAEFILTKYGKSKIINKFEYEFDRVFDISIDYPHVYFTADGVLHHNTVALLHTASTNILKGKNVLFLTLEMTEEEMGKRIDSNILDIDTNDFWSIPKEEFKKKFDAVKDSLGKLIIKEYPAGSFNTLKMESLISELQKEMDFTPDIICIDYLTLMASSRTTLAKAGNTYSYYKLIAEELHGFSKQFDVPIITAAQLGRGAFNNLEADMASIADSIGIIQTADTVIALLSSDNLKTNKQMVIKALKNRNTGRLDNLLVGTAFERMKFTEIEDSEQPQQPINESFQLGVPGLTQESNIDFGGFNFD